MRYSAVLDEIFLTYELQPQMPNLASSTHCLYPPVGRRASDWLTPVTTMTFSSLEDVTPLTVIPTWINKFLLLPQLNII